VSESAQIRRLGLALGVLGGAMVIAPAASGVDVADLVLRGGKVVTVDEARPEAQAIALRGAEIAAVGSNDEIARWIGPSTRVIELDGRLAIPGFIEGHGHFMALGEALTELDLGAARSWDDIVARVGAAARAASPGQWIVGRGWHQEKWDRPPVPAVEGCPVHASLSAATPENPVLLTHASGHAAFANARALAVAGLDRSSADPPGGELVRDAAGELTGLLRESAQDPVDAAYERAQAARSPAEVDRELRRQVRLAADEALQHGVTSFQDAGSSFATIDFLRRLEDEGALPLRLYVMVRPPVRSATAISATSSSAAAGNGTATGATTGSAADRAAATPGASTEELDRLLPAYRSPAGPDDYLAVRAIKRQIDGALGSHGAWLLEPYTDLPRSTGLVLEPVEEIRRYAELAIRHGYQLAVHAIGDRANREVLDVYQQTFERHGNPANLRWRIEHAQHLSPIDVPRFARLGVIASMQGIHCTSDAPWVLKRLGAARAESGAYRWRSLLQSGAIVSNGTDVPVERIDPVRNFYASVTRRTADGSLFYPDQRMTRAEALRSYTLAAAYAAFEEDRKGSLAPGKLADLVVLSRDLLTVPEPEILEARVDLTIVGGKVRFERAEAGQ
jgi:predicted amidohydrolase YtcJ